MRAEDIKLSFDDIESYGPGGVILNPGIHPIEVVEEEFGEKNGHPEVILRLKAIGGEERGGEISHWIQVTEGGLGYIKGYYEAFGVKISSGEFTWTPLKGLRAKAVVREKPKWNDPSKMVSEVKGYVALTEGDDAAAAVEEAFDGAEVKDDKDIPF